jgi:modulator of FtsH protease
MNYQQPPYGSAGYGTVAERAGTASLEYIRKVYALFTGGILLAIAGALIALYGVGTTTLGVEGEGLAVPTLVAFGMKHPWISIGIYFGAFFAASALRHRRVVNIVALFGYTFITGVFLAPMLFVAQLMASSGATLDPSPVRDAFLLTGAAFGGLTTYVFVTRKDFSFLGAGLTTGLWVLLGALVLNLFFKSAVFGLAAASVGVLLFAGFILYDTSRILHARDERDPVGAALGMFLNVVNMFIFLLRILSARRN